MCQKNTGRSIDEKILLANSPKSIISAAAVVFDDKGRILLVKSPWRGWEVPGGQVEEHEAITEGLKREVMEESGIEIEIIKMCGIFQNVKRGICCTLFTARAVGGRLTTSNESTEVGFFETQEALSMVTWLNFRERMEKCLYSKEPFIVEF